VPEQSITPVEKYDESAPPRLSLPGSKIVDRATQESNADGPIKGRLAPVAQPAMSLRSRIIQALRRAIETGILEPGVRLTERDLCEQLQVSRTSLREALGELQAEGILTYSAARRLSVSIISRTDAENAYRIRGELEALVVEQFIERANDDEMAALVSESKRLKSAYRSGDVDQMLVAKRSFYDRICSGAQNSLAFDIINRLVLRTSVLRRRSLTRKQRQSQSVKEVDQLMAAIGRRDIKTARKAAIQNVANSAKSVFGD
jgi:DNA-binding GntR family transcriptional regulator